MFNGWLAGTPSLSMLIDGGRVWNTRCTGVAHGDIDVHCSTSSGSTRVRPETERDTFLVSLQLNPYFKA